MTALSRNALIAGSVVLLHGEALWALQSGLMRSVVEIVVPVQLIDATVVTAPKIQEPEPPPPPPRPALVSPQARSPVRKAPAPLPPAPRPAAIPDTAPAPSAVTGTLEPQPPAPPVAAPVAPAPAPAALPAPAPAARVELPTSDADYLHNPPPKWPRMSERLGERGRVMVRVLIGTDGKPRTAEVKESSGYPRLDQASVEAVMSWRFVPGKRGGVPEEMWVLVPIRWGE